MKRLTPIIQKELTQVDQNFRRVGRGVNEIRTASDTTNTRIDNLTATVGTVIRSVLPTTFTSTTSPSYQDTGLDVTLPEPGTYIIHCDLRIATSSTASTYATVQLYNETTSTEVTDSHRISGYPTASNQTTITLTEVVTTTTADNVIRVNMKPSAAVTVILYNNSAGTSVMIAQRVA